MQRIGVIVVMVLALVMILPWSAAIGTTAGPSGGSAPSPVRLVLPSVEAGPKLMSTVVPATGLHFSRTVLIETFTAVWCPHCPAETEALWNIDQSTSHSVVTIGELHVCAYASGSGPCLDNYVPPDNTSYLRGAFYDVCGYPDVFFDGGHDVCGATTSVTQMQSEYEAQISNSSAIPGNVSIAQNASIGTHGVVVNANITSGMTNGTYNVVSYLVEYIGKKNVNEGDGPHDLAYVVRGTIINHPYSFTYGGVTSINGTKALNSTWNTMNLSVITFVQQNSTKDVENANMAPVTTLETGVSIARSKLSSTGSTLVTVHLTNSTTGDPVADANVTMASEYGGSFLPATGMTAANGTFTTIFTAPTVTADVEDQVWANSTATGYTSGSGLATVLVDTLVPPGAPLALAVGAGDGEAALSWNAPSTGGSGVSYNIYQSTSPTGTYSFVQTATTTSAYITGLSDASDYWYEINSYDTGGFSANTTAVAVAPVDVVASGLPSAIAWWIALDGQNFSGAGGSSLTLFIPAGTTTYSYGAEAYAFEPAGNGAAFAPGNPPYTLTLTFSLRLASLVGTVSPASATVVVNGSQLPVTNGGFQDVLPPGAYWVNVTNAGYKENSTQVILTPGNTTPITVTMAKVVSTGGGGTTTTSSSSGGLTNTEMYEIIAAVVVVAVAALLGVAYALPPRRGSGGANSSGRSRSSGGSPPSGSA